MQYEKIFKSKNLWKIISRTLSKIDDRLILHGERVAYIAMEITKYTDMPKEEIKNLIILSLLHDVGAYKTEEIDRMVEFESKDIQSHSIYGYLYLSKFSPLTEYAESILYHHTAYSNFKNITPSNKKSLEFAAIMKLADRVDILNIQGMTNSIEKILKIQSGTRLSPKFVDLFLKANRDNHIIDNLKSGEFHNIISNFFNSITLTKFEKRKYLELIAYSVDFKSEHTAFHTSSIVHIGNALGRYAELSHEEMHFLNFGCLLHDIGKISTPLRILEKPGRLTDEEMEIMKNHVVATSEILDGIIHPTVHKIAVSHHEKLDGSGYPLGLKEEHLSLADKVCMTADLMSALLNKRSYKDSFSREKTISIIESLTADGKICPHISSLALKNFDEILEASEKSTEQFIDIYKSIQKESKEIYTSQNL